MKVYICEGQAPNMVFHFFYLEGVPEFGPGFGTDLAKDLARDAVSIGTQKGAFRKGQKTTDYVR